jgi:flavin-dependent dehydrogenase
MYTYSKTIPVIAEPDVFIAGSGSAGSTAAIASARELQSSKPQAKVLDVERYGFLGGTSTAELDTI